MDWNNPVTYSIARPPGNIGEWFYHRVFWKDMNGDSLIDALTSRAQQILITGTHLAELTHPHPWLFVKNNKLQPVITTLQISQRLL